MIVTRYNRFFLQVDCIILIIVKADYDQKMLF